MLETLAVQALRAWNVLAQEPEAVGLAAALGDGGILDQRRGMGLGQDLLEDRIQRFPGARRGQLAQHVPVVRPRQRVHRGSDVPHRQIHRQARNEFE